MSSIFGVEIKVRRGPLFPKESSTLVVALFVLFFTAPASSSQECKFSHLSPGNRRHSNVGVLAEQLENWLIAERDAQNAYQPSLRQAPPIVPFSVGLERISNSTDFQYLWSAISRKNLPKLDPPFPHGSYSRKPDGSERPEYWREMMKSEQKDHQTARAYAQLFAAGIQTSPFFPVQEGFHWDGNPSAFQREAEPSRYAPLFPGLSQLKPSGVPETVEVRSKEGKISVPASKDGIPLDILAGYRRSKTDRAGSRSPSLRDFLLQLGREGYVVSLHKQNSRKERIHGIILPLDVHTSKETGDSIILFEPATGKRHLIPMELLRKGEKTPQIFIAGSIPAINKVQYGASLNLRSPDDLNKTIGVPLRYSFGKTDSQPAGTWNARFLGTGKGGVPRFEILEPLVKQGEVIAGMPRRMRTIPDRDYVFAHSDWVATEDGTFPTFATEVSAAIPKHDAKIGHYYDWHSAKKLRDLAEIIRDRHILENTTEQSQNPWLGPFNRHKTIPHEISLEAYGTKVADVLPELSDRLEANLSRNVKVQFGARDPLPLRVGSYFLRKRKSTDNFKGNVQQWGELIETLSRMGYLLEIQYENPGIAQLQIGRGTVTSRYDWEGFYQYWKTRPSEDLESIEVVRFESVVGAVPVPEVIGSELIQSVRIVGTIPNHGILRGRREFSLKSASEGLKEKVLDRLFLTPVRVHYTAGGHHESIAARYVGSTRVESTSGKKSEVEFQKLESSQSGSPVRIELSRIQSIEPLSGFPYKWESTGHYLFPRDYLGGENDSEARASRFNLSNASEKLYPKQPSPREE